jgi:hypothetical protein|tara:strand:+ start:339 stop:509 length:171 start_codon:yes stop_codon:yes gene_type:complete
MSLKRKSAAKVPYEGYALPKSSEKGGQFVDFNKILKMKVVKKVMKKRKHANISTNK